MKTAARSTEQAVRTRRKHAGRHGAVLVEVALVAPLAILLIFGVIMGGIAVFRLHQVTALANEGARWASVHGPKYAKQTGKPLPTAQDVFENAIKPLATSLDEEDLHCDLSWNKDKTTVSVSLSYRGLPNFMGKDFTVNGFSELPVSN